MLPRVREIFTTVVLCQMGCLCLVLDREDEIVSVYLEIYTG